MVAAEALISGRLVLKSLKLPANESGCKSISVLARGFAV